MFLHAVPAGHVHRSLHEGEVHCQLPTALSEWSPRLPEDHVSVLKKNSEEKRIFLQVSKACCQQYWSPIIISSEVLNKFVSSLVSVTFWTICLTIKLFLHLIRILQKFRISPNLIAKDSVTLNLMPRPFLPRYRTAPKPVYQVKQKVLKSLQWKCCPGFIGKDCEQRGKQSWGTSIEMND